MGQNISIFYAFIEDTCERIKRLNEYFLAGTDHNFPDQSWTKWMNCPSGWAMAGVKTQVESKIGGTFGGLN